MGGAVSPVIRVPGEGPWNPLAATPNPAPPVDDAAAAVRGQVGSWARQGMRQFSEASLDEVRGQYGGISQATISAALAVLEAEGLIEAAGGGRWTIRDGR